MVSQPGPSSRDIHTGRLIMRPVSGADLPDLQALKADPRVFAIMLGGVRTPQRTAEELAEETLQWARRGVGLWALRLANGGRFVGIAGLMERADGRGLALRFALRTDMQGQGFAAEAAGAALRFAHERAAVPRVVAVCRESNIGSRIVLGAIGMRHVDSFERDGNTMLLYESTAGG
jgi:RimJ/RimL family protein N-acetyltransferase